MFKTRITELFGIKYPIIQGGMMRISRAELVAAVSNAGGLGILTTFAATTPEELTDEIKKTRDLTDKPFGVNIPLLPALKPVDFDMYFDVILKSGVKIFETAGGSPAPYIERLKAAGAKIIHKCTTVRRALAAERLGCDAINIEGFECGGHPGEEDITTLILIPLTVDAVEIPVVATGGFGNGRGLIAALALGAEAITMGTCFMATRECPIHPRVKEWLVRASEHDTILVERSLHNTMRALKNSVAQKVVEMEKRGATLEELAPLISGQQGKKLLETGALDSGLFSAGQVVGLIRDIPTVQQLIDRIIKEAEEVISHIGAQGIFERVRKPYVPH